LAMLLRDGMAFPVQGGEAISWAGFARNLVPVISGNLVGGSVLVALVYHVIYRRGSRGERA
ncbi:MAG: formate transporter FocA, partial [Betaproteobacteria bacterium]